MRDISSDLPIRLAGVEYGIASHKVLAGVDLELDQGSPTILLGANGSGKTTLLKLAMGLLAPTGGRIEFSGRVAPVSRRRAIVFQKPVMLRRTAAANIAFALSAAGRSADAGAVDGLLARVGLSHTAARPARRLSGGEQQRLSLARALARDPEVLFLDEPTASLDPSATKSVEDIIASIADTGVKVVMATHDLGQARRLAGEIVFLAKGRLVEKAPAREFFSAPSTEEARRFLAGDLVF